MAGIKQINKQKKNVDLDTMFLGNQDEWLLKTLDSHLYSIQEPQRPGVFYPSALGNPCNRFLYMAYNGLLVSKPLESNTQRIFDNGGYLEERMDTYFKGIGILIDREVSLLLDSPPISGRCDFILAHDTHKKIIVELKSINDRGFKALKQFPKPEHELQLQIYLNLLPAEWGTVLYENKNDQKLKAFLLKRNSNVFEQIIKRCNKVMRMVEMPKMCRGNKWCPCKDVQVGG